MGTEGKAISTRDIAAFALAIVLAIACIRFWEPLAGWVHSHFSNESATANAVGTTNSSTGIQLSEASDWATNQARNDPGLSELLGKLRVNYVEVITKAGGVHLITLYNRTDDELMAITAAPLMSKYLTSGPHVLVASPDHASGACSLTKLALSQGINNSSSTSVADCAQDGSSHYVSHARYMFEVEPVGPTDLIALSYLVIFRDGHVDIYGRNGSDHGVTNGQLFEQLVYPHIRNAVVQMALDWRARQAVNPWVAKLLNDCTFIHGCSENEKMLREVTDLHRMGGHNAFGKAVMAFNGIGPDDYIEIKTLEDPYIVGTPVFPNMGGDQFERALQFGYEYCCEGDSRTIVSTPASFLTKEMGENVAYEFYAYTSLHPDYLVNNPRWFVEHETWSVRLREAGIWIPPGLVTQADVKRWVNEGRSRYPETLGWGEVSAQIGPRKET